jgi:hypothetical protein
VIISTFPWTIQPYIDQQQWQWELLACCCHPKTFVGSLVDFICRVAKLASSPNGVKDGYWMTISKVLYQAYIFGAGAISDPRGCAVL